ncbi:NADH-quinone oxidoreductase subunit NuoE, partial [Candidatus Pelagibacter sp.]|nr:NADH-quinone oxidoreductase subunit NuoE [Candidatus Pelagibacter sp.]
MSLRRPAKDQPENFEFNSSSLEAANTIVSKYPKGKQQSAVMALLYIAQKQNNNWIPLAAMKCIAKFLDMPYIKVYEVATFYTMYNLSPVGKYFVQVCTTTPCMIRGANQLVEACKEKISNNETELSDDKSCSWMEVECLGACVNAPMM